MSDPRSPFLQRIWHAALLLLGILVVLWLILQLLAEIWPWLLLLGAIGLACYVGVLWWRNRQRRW